MAATRTKVKPKVYRFLVGTEVKAQTTHVIFRRRPQAPTLIVACEAKRFALFLGNNTSRTFISELMLALSRIE